MTVSVQLLPSGERMRVSAARAARLIATGAAQPDNWNLQDLEAVESAHAARQRRAADVLADDGLLVNDAVAPNEWRLTMEVSRWR